LEGFLPIKRAVACNIFPTIDEMLRHLRSATLTSRPGLHDGNCSTTDTWGTESWMSRHNQHDWRELCAAAANEPDPEKLASLVDQIIQAMELNTPGSSRDRPSESAS
jgi:hypothetical protein